MKTLQQKLENPNWLFWGILLIGLMIVFIAELAFLDHLPYSKGTKSRCECPPTVQTMI
ncbi:MAG: hypothetical protein MUE85_11415 [Microscillaceae bacterium]|jgi:hypothetical protein|nr:hypothetical protein [Microscillaceae bacterium]